MIDQFDRRNFTQRLELVQKKLKTCLDTMVEKPDVQSLENRWEKIWENCRSSLLADMEWTIEEVARQFSKRDSNPNTNLIGRLIEHPAEQETGAETSLIVWNQAAQVHLADALDQFIDTIDTNPMRTKSFRMAFEKIPNQAPQLVNSVAEDKLLASLVTIGSLSRRLFFHIANVSVISRPLTTLSTKKTVIKSLLCGIEAGVDRLGEVIQQSIEETVEARAGYYTKGVRLMALCKVDRPGRTKTSNEE